LLACVPILATLVSWSTTSAAGSGLLVAYGFSEGTGGTTNDSSLNAAAGMVNNTTWTTTGKFNDALVFNGTTSYVDLGRPSVLTGNTSSMTWEAWVYPTGTPADDGQIIAFADGTIGWELKTTPDAGSRTFGVLVDRPNA